MPPPHRLINYRRLGGGFWRGRQWRRHRGSMVGRWGRLGPAGRTRWWPGVAYGAFDQQKKTGPVHLYGTQFVLWPIVILAGSRFRKWPYFDFFIFEKLHSEARFHMRAYSKIILA